MKRVLALGLLALALTATACVAHAAGLPPEGVAMASLGAAAVAAPASESLQLTDSQSAAVAVAPRVTLAEIEASIAARHDFRASAAVEALGHPALEPLELLSVCILVMKNGFTVIGKSAPASAANFDLELGRKFAYEDAVRQLWPLMGYALRDRLASAPG